MRQQSSGAGVQLNWSSISARWTGSATQRAAWISVFSNLSWGSPSALSPASHLLLQQATGPFDFDRIVAVAEDPELALLAVENIYPGGSAKVFMISSSGQTVVLASEEPFNAAMRQKAAARSRSLPGPSSQRN